MNMSLLAAYSYQNWALEASGEYASNHLIQPGAEPYISLEERMMPHSTVVDSYGIDMEEGAEGEGGWQRVRGLPPVTFLYGGGHDWMDFRRGRRIAMAIVKAGGHAWFEMVGRIAGHVVYIDDPLGFQSSVFRAIQRAHDSGACNIQGPPKPADFLNEIEAGEAHEELVSPATPAKLGVGASS